ncbi:hypothetical protein, partial [Schleiferia thermophila]
AALCRRPGAGLRLLFPLRFGHGSSGCGGLLSLRLLARVPHRPARCGSYPPSPWRIRHVHPPSKCSKIKKPETRILKNNPTEVTSFLTVVTAETVARGLKMF